MAELISACPLGDDGTGEDSSSSPCEAAVNHGRLAGIRRSAVLAHSTLANLDTQQA